MQGFITSEPYAIRKAGVEPVVHLLADNGFANYSDILVVPAQDGGGAQGRGAALRRRLDQGLEELPLPAIRRRPMR